MDEEFESLASASAANKNVGSGLEVALLRDYVEQLERRQLDVAQSAHGMKLENEQRAKDQADVYFYLNKKLDDNYDVINNLESQIIREQSEREISEKEYENALEALQAKMLSEDARYKSKIFELEDKLELMREFMSKKDEFQQEITELKATLEKERRNFTAKCEDLDKTRILEKKQLREEFDIEIASIKRHHKEDIDSKLSTKAKKSKMLNTMYKSELKYQTLQAEEVLVHDKEIMEKDRARRNELQLFKGMEEEMQKKLSEYQRTIKTLTKKLSDGDAKLTDTSIQDDLTKKYEQKCTEYDSLFVQYNRLQEDAINDKERYGKIWNVLMNYYYDFQKRGVRRPLNKLEIEANPERFVVELLFGVFEANPMRFRKAIRKQMGAENTNASLGGTSFFADETHNEDDLHQDSLSIMPDEHKWWSTQNTAYLTTPNSPDFAIVNNPGSTGSGFSVPSSNKTNRGAQSSKSVQGLKPNRNPTCRSTGVQTDESYFAANLQNRNRPAADDSLSLTSSNFVIDSFSAPNLRTASGVLSTSGSSVFMDGFGGASVDRGLGGHKLRKTTVNFSNFDPISFSRKKKISKKIVLPRMNHLATPPTPQTDFSISGHQAGFVPNNSQSQNLL